MMQLSIEHQGREALHGIAMLLQCLRLPAATDAERHRWWRDIRQLRVALGALYVAGLPRDFRHKVAR
jgi:hypothetical protein